MLVEISCVLCFGVWLVIETYYCDLFVLRWLDSDWWLMGEGWVLLEQRMWDFAVGIAQTM